MDVIVIGAGAAGLAAASALSAEKLAVIVLEARERSGGRVWTMHDARAPVPIELGAEFVHGEASETEQLAQRAGAVIYDVEGEHWQAQAGRVRRVRDFWNDVGKVMSKLDEEREPDRSFADFLRDRPGGRTLAAARTHAQRFVQGFHAADLSRISERALAGGGNPGQDESAARQGRVVQGYHCLLQLLERDVLPHIRFGAVVQRVSWQRHAVEVTTATDTFEARAALVTVPLGVLQAGDIAFEPRPRAFDALAGLAMGEAMRVSLLFRDRFWESDVVASATSSLARLGFLHTPASSFNIWWTLHPLRAPLITGWSGGPPARALAAERDLEGRALSELSAQLGVSRRRLANRLEAVFTHNWSTDPFSRGAYSYAVVGGADASQQLARSETGTLFFAGEAAAGEHSGTVEGALLSGKRTAQRILRALA